MIWDHRSVFGFSKKNAPQVSSNRNIICGAMLMFPFTYSFLMQLKIKKANRYAKAKTVTAATTVLLLSSGTDP